MKRIYHPLRSFFVYPDGTKIKIGGSGNNNQENPPAPEVTEDYKKGYDEAKKILEDNGIEINEDNIVHIMSGGDVSKLKK